MTQQIKWGIIGCGDVTEVKSGPAFNKVPDSKLVAVMRRNADKAADYARRHGVPKWYADADELINDPDVNAIYIATPPSTHAGYTLAALQAGKPVYVEKPMALNAAEARQMFDYATEKNVKLCVAHYRRLQPMFLKIKSLIDTKVIGDIRFVQLQLLQSSSAKLIARSEENWRTDPALSGGGLFHDLAPHQIDLMLYLFGAIEQYRGEAFNQANVSAADDLVNGSLLFANGVVFNGLWCFTVNESDTADICTIYGSEGNISFGFFGQNVSVTINGQTELLEFPPLQHVEQPMIEKVVTYFLGHSENPCDGAVGTEVMEIIDAFAGTTTSG
ncbi:Gfo/Idh/MocA family oxidoreductase [Niabella yanshanensis]|uniref:Gfo/Idh/MocA family oxidoreductase n=1 Tax=Niabella yanshanensis TaxID=577386 RepID=A0ABZ0W3L4_9BACT|nr:Gfo/Idh/MocA family oxidoreductase [Niabella yanshanensis]WQD37868.1 Gfo/Idh/MocA family oxidoreductase [Niabella yanshanensis]